MIYNLLFPYQKKLVDELKELDSCGLFTDVGTGKSIMSLALYEHKFMQHKVNKAVIICLNSKVEEWEKDIKRWFPFSKSLIYDKKVKTLKQFESFDYDFLIINFEKTWRTKELLAHIKNNTYIIIDESHKIKENNTKQSEFIIRLSRATQYKCILTATPQNKGYIDFYNQLDFLGLMNMSYKHFMDEYVIRKLVNIPGVRTFYDIVGYQNTEYLDSLISKYCRYYERNIDDDLIPSEIKVDIPIDEHYFKISNSRVYEDIVMNKASRKRLGLKSLCSGTIMGKTLFDETKTYELNTNKIEWVKDFLTTFDKRVVIYYEYTHQMKQLYNELKKLKRTIARYNGEYKEQDLFLKNDNAIILVQYRSGATGIDWLKNSYVAIFYSLPDSYIDFYQAKGRLNRIGQKNKPLFYLLVAKGKATDDEIKSMNGFIKGGGDINKINNIKRKLTSDELNFLSLENKKDFDDTLWESLYGEDDYDE